MNDVEDVYNNHSEGILSRLYNFKLDDTSTDADCIDDFIFSKYLEIFDAESNKIPSTKEIYMLASYEFETKALDIIYKIESSYITEDKIREILTFRKAVFRWGGFVCGDAQQVMFSDIFEESIDNLIGGDIRIDRIGVV